MMLSCHGREEISAHHSRPIQPIQTVQSILALLKKGKGKVGAIVGMELGLAAGHAPVGRLKRLKILEGKQK